MTTEMKKVWFVDGQIIEQEIPESEIYKQEPVAYTTGHCKQKAQPGGCQLHNLHCGYPDCDRKAVTTPPEVQRTWVGLTDEDMKDPRTHNFDFIHGARWAEAKLKEKNDV